MVGFREDGVQIVYENESFEAWNFRIISKQMILFIDPYIHILRNTTDEAQHEFISGLPQR